MSKQRTATIERYPVHGTWRFELAVRYRGETLRWWADGAHVFALIVDDPTRDDTTGLPVAVQAARQHAKAQGFTHVRFTGDWSKRTMPKNGRV